MLYIQASTNSPKVIIDFTKLLFEINGNSYIDDPLIFYKPVLEYIETNFYQIKDSIYHYRSISITLHFYIKYINWQNLEIIRQIDCFFSRIKEFDTYIYWYYNSESEDQTETAVDVEQTFLNKVRLIKN